MSPRPTGVVLRTLALAALLVAGLGVPSPAHAAPGSLSDPKGDYPDIVRLAWNNAQTRVVMKMTYAEFRAQNESFYMRFGANSYQVFVSSSAGIEQLRYNGNARACDGLRVRHSATALRTTVVVPRGCLRRAPDRLRFQGIATEGLTSADETRISGRVARG
jgi:hypothetical protein